MKKFVVFYAKGCIPHLGFFKSKSEAKRFVIQFMDKAIEQDNLDGNWVDGLVEGKLEGEWPGYVQNPKQSK